MVNSPQSGRRATLSPQIAIPSSSSISEFSETNMSDYFVNFSKTKSGETDVKFNKREKANPFHYLIIFGAVGVGLYLLNKKIGDI